MAISEVTVDELAEALGVGARVIDVREISEYEEVHIPGAQLVVLSSVPDNVSAFVGQGSTYVVCRSGGRSMQACLYLEELGHSAINVAGGTMAWIASGRETTVGPQPE